MKTTTIKHTSVIFFIAICCSLILPHYETITDGILNNSISFISQFPNPDPSGFFGGGYYTTFNGFGSLNTIINVVISFFITIMLYKEKLSRRILLYLSILMIVLHLLSILDIIIAPFLLNESDTLKIGFYTVRLLELVLLYFAFVQVKELQIRNTESSVLADDQINKLEIWINKLAITSAKQKGARTHVLKAPHCLAPNRYG